MICCFRREEIDLNNGIVVSVFVVTYKSDWEKLRLTLESIVIQQNIAFEIVVSDDGSEENHYEAIKEYFQEKHFQQYTLVENIDNVGTVRNCIRALEGAKGEYVKSISPGDLLIGKNCLADWVKALHKSGKKWAFGDYICYKRSGVDEVQLETHSLLPKNIEPYLVNDEAKIRYISVVEGDRPGGIATIFERKIWQRQLERTASLVRYAEDLSYYLMFLESYIPLYFRKNVVAYEIGEGISTSGSEYWMNIMEQEGYAVNEYIKNTKSYSELLQQKEKYQRKFNEIWRRRSSLDRWQSELTTNMYLECCKPYISDIQKLSVGRKIWIYGAGFGGKVLEQLLLEHGMEIEGYIDQNYEELQGIMKTKVISMNEVDASNAFIVVSLVEIVPEVINSIKRIGMDKHYIYIPAIRKMKITELVDIC